MGKLPPGEPHFYSYLSHQIRSPLATASFSLQTIQRMDRKLPEADRQKLMQTAIDRLLSTQDLVKKYFDLEAIRAGLALAEVERVGLARAVKAAVGAARPAAQEKGIELVVHEIDESCTVSADPAGLQTMLDLLLDNAIRYSEAGAGPVEIEAAAAGEQVRITIRDHGVGIPADEREEVFEPLHRVHRAESDGTAGAGLGLSIAKALAERYSGGIRLESRDSQGTTVSVHLIAGDKGADS